MPKITTAGLLKSLERAGQELEDAKLALAVHKAEVARLRAVLQEVLDDACCSRDCLTHLSWLQDALISTSAPPAGGGKWEP